MGIIKVTVDKELEAKLRASARSGGETLSAHCRRLLVLAVRNLPGSTPRPEDAPKVGKELEAYIDKLLDEKPPG